MRAGPLANADVIQLLNCYFVPVYTSNDEVPGTAEVAKKEQAERDRVYRAFLDAKLPAGSVHVYVLSPDLKPLGSIHVAHAGDKDKATGKDRTQLLLEKTIADLKVEKSKPVVAPKPQSAPPNKPADALLLHLTARKLTEKGSWNEFPSEDWIVLDAEQLRKLLPADQVKVGDSWAIDKAVSTPILTRFFPQTECCTAKDSVLLSETSACKHRLKEQALKATVIEAGQGRAVARLDGRSKVLHQFYPNHRYPPTVSTAKIVGYMTFDVAKRKIESLRLVSDDGKFDKMNMGVAVRLVP
jgi:hypothetical protein